MKIKFRLTVSIIFVFCKRYRDAQVDYHQLKSANIFSTALYSYQISLHCFHFHLKLNEALSAAVLMSCYHDLTTFLRRNCHKKKKKKEEKIRKNKRREEKREEERREKKENKEERE